MWGLSYWVFPIISGLCWLGTLLGLLIHWTAAGEPHYPSMSANQSIAYISDIGAQELKPLFIAGSCVTTVFLDLAFISERWLRHQGRLAKNITTTEKVLSGLSLISAIIGTAGLILLSIFDTLRHPRLHNVFLLLFIGGFIISAIFICWEYQRLGIHFRQHRILRLSFWTKLAFILVEFALAVAFAITTFRGSHNAAAVLEWTVAFIFTFYVFTFFIDLVPAVHTQPTQSFRAGTQTQMQMEANDDESIANMAYYDGRNLGDSDRTLTANDPSRRNAKPLAPVTPHF